MPQPRRLTAETEPEHRDAGGAASGLGGATGRNGSAPPAPLRRFPATCTIAQISQIGFMPVPEDHRQSPVRRIFDRKNGAGAKQDWAEVIRRHYDAAAKEPVPEEFRKLMDEIARKIEK